MSGKIIIALSTSVLLSCANTVNATSTNPKPIARLLTDGDRTKPKGSLIFSGEHLNPKDGKSLQILCYLNYQILDIVKGNLESKCNEASKPSINNCEINRTCPKVKKTSQSLAIPKITQPFGHSISNLRPSVSWKPVSGAISYTVVLDGHGINWSRETKNTTLPYPENIPSLENGNVYTLGIIANGIPKTYSSTTLITLLDSEVQEIKKKTQIIKSFNLKPDEEVRDLDAIYMSYNLLTDSINLLSQRIAAGTKDPVIYNLLRKRLEEAEFPQKALSTAN